MLNKLITPAGLGLVICSFLLISCSKSTEAKTRQEQEKMFIDLFGFEPPKAIADIKYRDVYNRHLMDGAWGRWMTFTYNEKAFSRILKEEGYKQRDELQLVSFDSDAAPKWWPNVEQSKVTIYLRGQDDTEKSEGYSFQEHIWHDTNSNRVYFYKRYWD